MSGLNIERILGQSVIDSIRASTLTAQVCVRVGPLAGTHNARMHRGVVLGI